MKTPERFDRALKALVQAFFNDTLINTDCHACAVGNIVAAGKGLKLLKIDNPEYSCYYAETESGYDNGAWFDLSHFKNRDKSKLAIENIAVTGYSYEELLLIESAFMGNCELDTSIKMYSKEAVTNCMYNGLMAVVDVLCEIEGLESTEYKKAFEYTNDSKPVKK